MKITLHPLLVIGSCLATTSVASAHIAFTGPAFANATYEGSLSVGHGCPSKKVPGTMVDTFSVTVDIPAGVTGVRAVDSTLGKAVVNTSGATVVSITWTKLMTDVLSSDADFYRLPFRAKMPSAPFTTLYFDAHQRCLDEDGNEMPPVDWVGHGQTTALPDGAPPPEPAPAAFLLPARVPGWNKFTVPQLLTDLTVFKDAEIVWAGNAAYSANPNYQSLIGTEPDTVALTQIAAGTDVWVKY